MRLYISGSSEVELIEQALQIVVQQGGKDKEAAQKILDRIDRCKELQKPHNKTHLTSAGR